MLVRLRISNMISFRVPGVSATHSGHVVTALASSPYVLVGVFATNVHVPCLASAPITFIIGVFATHTCCSRIGVFACARDISGFASFVVGRLRYRIWASASSSTPAAINFEFHNTCPITHVNTAFMKFCRIHVGSMSERRYILVEPEHTGRAGFVQFPPAWLTVIVALRRLQDAAAEASLFRYRLHAAATIIIS